MRLFGGFFKLALMTALAWPSLALAQADPAAADRKVGAMLDQAHAVYGVPDRRQRCKPAVGDEIVVCADHGGDQRVPSTAESDPSSLAARRNLNNGVPRAPQLDRGYCASCQHFGKVPPPVYYVDLDSLPVPPEGSDADKIAKGEMTAP